MGEIETLFQRAEAGDTIAQRDLAFRLHEGIGVAQDMSAMGITYFPGEGQGEDPSWPAEASFLALGIDREAASDLGRKYGQNAIVWIGSDGLPELVLLRSSGQTL